MEHILNFCPNSKSNRQQKIFAIFQVFDLFLEKTGMYKDNKLYDVYI